MGSVDYVICQGDMLEAMKDIEDDTFTAIVCDPPYGLGSRQPRPEEILAYLNGQELDVGGDFMNKKWNVPSISRWKECLRVLKPGGYLVSFAGARTQDLIGIGIRMAGFDVEEGIAWLNIQGMPHGHNIKSLGEGTHLRPLNEPIILAQKPFRGTVEACRAEYGTATLSIDACRLPNPDGSGPRKDEPSAERRYTEEGSTNFANKPGPRGGSEDGYWPPNVAVDEVVAEQLGQAARHFLCAKASKEEKEAGLTGELQIVDDGRKKAIDNPFLRGKTARRNIHPTPKPIELMRWLVRLVSRPGDLILDPFCGSGSTLIAALLEGRDVVGIENHPPYVALAKERVAAWKELL